MAGTSITISLDQDLYRGLIDYCHRFNQAVSTAVNRMVSMYLTGIDRTANINRGFQEGSSKKSIQNGDFNKIKLSVYVDIRLVSLLDVYCRLEQVSRSAIISRAIAVFFPSVASSKIVFGEYRQYLWS